MLGTGTGTGTRLSRAPPLAGLSSQRGPGGGRVRARRGAGGAGAAVHPSMVANLSARPGRAPPHHPPPARSPFLGLHVLGTEASPGAGPPAGGAAAHWAPFPEEPRSWRPGPADAPPPVPSCGGPSRCVCRAAALRPQPGGPGQCLGAVPKPISESRDPHPSPLLPCPPRK